MGSVKTGAYNPLPVGPVVLVGANVNGKPNCMAVGFVNGVNIKPAIVYVSLNKKHHTPNWSAVKAPINPAFSPRFMANWRLRP
jgi:hypothetical protein